MRKAIRHHLRMPRTRVILALLLLCFAFMGGTQKYVAYAQSSDFSALTPITLGATEVLCSPGVYLNPPGDCLLAGPSAYLTELARLGISLPRLPLDYSPIDPSLGEVDVRYGQVVNRNAPVYGSLEDAIKRNKKNAVAHLDGKTVYISYTQETEMDGRRFYMIDFNQWMTANDVSRIGVLPRSNGLIFRQTPKNPFGWVLNYFAPGPIETKRTPGHQNQDYTGHVLELYEVVQVYAEEVVDGESWYLIAPQEWVLGKYVARVLPNTTPPAGVNNDRWIEVNLFDQTLAVYDQRHLIFATIIASGAEPFWTQPGLFQIYEKHEKTPMRGSFSADGSDAYYLEDVPWTMYYDQARALHGAYWRTKMGFEQSHGCINMAVGDAHWLFNWAQVGDWVYVWDPSGRTPTDPALYGAGGF